MTILTRNEETLMIAIWSLKDNAYGVTIMEKFQEISNKNIVFGTLYNSLAKLEKKGYVDIIAGEPTPERGGKRKIFYTVSPEGMKALQRAKEFQMVLWKYLPDLKVKSENHDK